MQYVPVYSLCFALRCFWTVNKYVITMIISAQESENQTKCSLHDIFLVMTYLGIDCPSSSGLSFSSAISSSAWLSSSSGVEGCGLLPANRTSHEVQSLNFRPLNSPSLPYAWPRCDPAPPENHTCTEVTSWPACVRLQQHALGRHLGAEGSLDVVHKNLAVGAVHPYTLSQWIFDVHLLKHNQKIIFESMSFVQCFYDTLANGLSLISKWGIFLIDDLWSSLKT